MPNTEPDSVEVLARSAGRLCACFQARQLARQITRAYDTAMRETGLKATQFTVLAAVVGSREAVCLTELADHLGMERSTFSRNLMPLVKRGLVEHSDTLKGRSRGVAATADGRRLFADAQVAWKSAQDQFREELTQAGQTDFLANLRQVNAQLKG